MEAIRRVYFPKKSITPFFFANFVQNHEHFFFSYGRYALKEVFIAYGLKKDDVVLFPEFICRDLLSAANLLELKIIFYPVNERLEMAESPDSLPTAKAIIAVNYFGFPQDLVPFKRYQKINDCLLIEDNAHGFLSCTPSGEVLGLRADVGLFSLRKSIPSYLGSAVVLIRKPKSSIPIIVPQVGGGQRGKELIRKWAGIFEAVSVVQALTEFLRFIRQVRTGEKIPRSDESLERDIPGSQEPTRFFMDRLVEVDDKDFILQRRKLYIYLEEYLSSFGVKSVFEILPLNVVPYGFPFVCSPDKIGQVQDALQDIGLECFSWPDLPTTVQQKTIPEFYRQTYLVRFLW